VGAIMLKGKQANEYDACNWNFHICKIIDFSAGNATVRGMKFTVCHATNDNSSMNTKKKQPRALTMGVTEV